jgi:spore maturation protein CgeB
MKLVVFGLTVSSSWGNGHATLWRGLIKALARRGHEVHFLERDVPYYSQCRDLYQLPEAHLHFYSSLEEVSAFANQLLSDADVGMVTSYCPEGVLASDIVLSSRAGMKVFYDMDTPVTLDELDSGNCVSYIGPRGLQDFDLVLSYTGGEALQELKRQLGGRRAEPLYGSVDPEVHRPSAPVDVFRADCSYLGTYAEDRQRALEELFIDPARNMPDCRFLIGGAKYPEEFPWSDNIFFVRHVAPADHPAFFSSGGVTVNVTRRAMAEMGYCPSGRLFEAAACGAPILSDYWEGLEQFFAVGEEILVSRSTEDTVAALGLSDAEKRRIAQAGRERVLAEHTANHRALELERILATSMEVAV